MNAILTIAKRELNTFFDSLIAYILLTLFLGFSGFFTWIYGIFGPDVFLSDQASIFPFFNVAYLTLFIFIPALTMRMFAEERKTGTLELLLTQNVTNWQVVWGKYLACLSLVGIALLFSLPYYFTVSWLGKPDHGAIWCGYVGILLLSSAYIGIGLLASSLTDNQIEAFLISLFVILFFVLIAPVLANNLPAPFSYVFNYLSILYHYDAISRGVIDTKNVLFFVSITAFCLVLTEAQLSKRNLVDA